MKPSRDEMAATVEVDPDDTLTARPKKTTSRPPPPSLPGRYEDLGPIAAGSFGEVRRVRDTLLDRVLAMKILHAEHIDRDDHRRRFLAEAQITAQLQHPGVVALYDRGELEDGRLWFTMKEVRGRTLREVIDELHAASSPDGWGVTATGWTFRRLVDAFARIAQAVAFAHGRGVVHRDLKPENVMVGEFGEILVMDWGLARRSSGAADPLESVDDEPPLDDSMTRYGDVLGTPAYMAPEQAHGDSRRHGPWSDVYALGAVLYHLLSGRPPYRHGGGGVIVQLLAGPPQPVAEAASGKVSVPAELADVCERAMRREIGERYAGAERLAEDVVAWLDGLRRREQALAQLEQARAFEPEIAAARAQAEEARARARALEAGLRPFDPIEEKRPVWALDDEAARLARAAALAEARWLQALHGALSVDPALPEAHARLADHYRVRLGEAELAHREDDAARFEVLLRTHDRGPHAAFLRGDGAITLVTDPPGAEVVAERYVLRDRRLCPEHHADLGRTPLREAALPCGSYLVRIRAPGRAEVRYPVLVERGGHWDGRAPGEVEPHPIALPDEGELGPDDCYVPAGWCRVGGDREAVDSVRAQRIWIDAFVVRRYPVTNAEYLTFLDDMVAEGREEEAIAACPRPSLGMPGAAGELIYGRDPDGRFVLTAAPGDGAGQVWQPSWPVVLIDWHAATIYASWVVSRTGAPWRLPDELEREKAARGADGRFHPWGNHFDATWACVADSYAADAARVGVERYPLDESPCGARGLAGNVRDWCANVWTADGPAAPGGRLRLAPAAMDAPDLRAVRGGAWTTQADRARSAARFAGRPGMRWRTTGLRLVRSFRG